MHQADEHVAVADIEGLTRIYQRFVRQFLAALMPTWLEIVRSVQAAWLLARGDKSALAQFDLSVDGFWKSFAAALVVAPAYILVLLDQYRFTGWPENAWATALAELVSFAGGWIAFPLAAIPLTRLLGLGARYVPLIVADNWSAVIQVAALHRRRRHRHHPPGGTAHAGPVHGHHPGPDLSVVRDPHRARDHWPYRLRPGGVRRAAQHHRQPAVGGAAAVGVGPLVADCSQVRLSLITSIGEVLTPHQEQPIRRRGRARRRRGHLPPAPLAPSRLGALPSPTIFSVPDDVPHLVVQERARPQAAFDQLAVAARHGYRPVSSPATPTGIRWSGSW